MNLVSKFPSRNSCVFQDAAVQRDRGVDALHHKHLERPRHAGHGLRPVFAVDNQLGDQRIVIRRHDAFGILRRIHAHAVATGNIEGGDAAGGGGELLRMFGIDPALDGVAANGHRFGKNAGQRFARGDAQLRFHQVDAGHRLGDRMLHLDAGVHLDEVELAVLIHEELDRTGVLIADGGQAPS